MKVGSLVSIPQEENAKIETLGLVTQGGTQDHWKVIYIRFRRDTGELLNRRRDDVLHNTTMQS